MIYRHEIRLMSQLDELLKSSNIMCHSKNDFSNFVEKWNNEISCFMFSRLHFLILMTTKMCRLISFNMFHFLFSWSKVKTTSYWHHVRRPEFRLTSDWRTWCQYDVVLMITMVVRRILEQLYHQMLLVTCNW